MIYWGHIEDEEENNTNNSYDEDIEPRNKNNQYRNINNLTNNSRNFIYDI